MDSAQNNQFIERHAARNFAVNVFDGGIFFMALAMVSRYTVLPLLVERLSGERWMQGLIPMLGQTGWFLPGLFIAPFITRLARRKPVTLWFTLAERLPWLPLGLILLFAPTAPPSLLLLAFFILFGIHAFGTGFTVVSWQDLMARIIPGRRWGVFFGVQSGLGGLLGVGGAAIAGFVLATQPFPQSIGILSLFSVTALVVSFCFLASSVEPDIPAPPRQSIGAFWRGLLPLLQQNKDFRRYLISRAAIALGLLGHSFLTAAALERFNLPNEAIAPFTAALLGSQAIADLILGWLADRWGHKQVLELATGIGVLALLLAIVAPSAEWFLPIFVLVGAAQAGYMLTGFTLVFSFSNAPERPTYIGLANTAIAPVAIIGPLSAGWLAEFAGYNTLFVLLIVIGLIGLAALHWRVTAPIVQHAPAESAG